VNAPAAGVTRAVRGLGTPRRNAQVYHMLFMVVERFKDGSTRLVGERFKREGRMLPERVSYVGSWMDAAGNRCFQLMEAPSAEALAPWTHRWDDLVDFEIVPVVTGAEFWASATFKAGT